MRYLWWFLLFGGLAGWLIACATLTQVRPGLIVPKQCLTKPGIQFKCENSITTDLNDCYVCTNAFGCIDEGNHYCTVASSGCGDGQCGPPPIANMFGGSKQKPDAFTSFDLKQ